MNRAVKVAISLPAETLREVEAFRKRTGKSRSAVFTEAVAALLAHYRTDDRDRRYVEAYLRRPARQEDAAAVAAAAVAAWEPWE
jgi:metal-responsive CopG/Arc/MetJ family transcriptional regulator